MGLIMKEIDIQSFTDLDDAMLHLEETIYTYIDNGFSDVRGELTIIDGKIRVSVITDDRQLELDI
jgi:hypothetical protein